MADLKDVFLVSGGIASAAISGGTVPAILAGIAGVSKLIGGGNDEPNPNDPKVQWMVEKIQEWMKLSLEQMHRPMRAELKVELLKDKIAGDWWQFFGTRAKSSWVNQTAEETWNAVKANIALGIAEAPSQEVT